MPVKVRCECGAGLTVPDAARGKRVKCKKCGSPVAVPKEPRRKKAARPKADVHDDDFFNQLDLGGAEHDEHRICPKCAADVSDEDIECPSCGINLETGVLSAKQKKKRKRGGPDPDLYYKAAWKDSWAFLKKNWHLGFKLGMFSSFFFTLYFAAAFMVTYCEKVPLRVFWGGLAIAFILGAIGSFWQMWTEVVKATVDQKDELKRFNFDFFADVALGIKAVFWPITLVFPVLVFFGALAAVLATPEFLIFGLIGLYVIPLFTFPVAMCHLSAKYTWKAYIPYHMIRLTLKNFVPVTWWWVIWWCQYLIAVVTSVAIGLYAQKAGEIFESSLMKLIELCGIATDPDQRGFMFSVVAAVFGFGMVYLTVLVLSALSCIPSLFLMRATGLLAYYFQRDLETGFKVNANEPAGFWVRYLAYLIDLTVINVVGGVAGGLFIVARLMLLSLEMDWIPEVVNYAPGVLSLVFSIVYFVMGESGPSRATMGMKSLGLTVVNDDGSSPISPGAAFMRYIGRIVSAVPLGIGFFMCAFDKDRKTLHDKMTKTKVVWKGEVH